LRLLRHFLTGLTCFALSPAFAATLVKQEDGGVRHGESGWLFPPQIGGFEVVQDAQIVPRTDDVAASYGHGAKGKRITATIFVYAADSAAQDGSYAGAKQAIAASLRGGLNQLWSEGPFLVGADRSLLGQKAFYKIGLGEDSGMTNLYFVDTGRWIVKVRITAERVEKDTFKTIDDFVRALPWTSLALDAARCSGPACSIARPMPIHGMIPETLALLLTSKSPDLDKDDGRLCEAGDFAAAIAAAPRPDVDGKGSPPVEMVHACTIGERRVNVVRFVLPDEIRTKMIDTPDGLTLRGPFSFAVVRDKAGTHYSELHDGMVDAPVAEAIIGRIAGNRQVDFANARRGAERPTPVIRGVD
jgi:hypothetical protein